jgi:hypothetical protein
MSNYHLSRRRFITSTGAMFVLPMLESLFATKASAAMNDPRRYVGIYMPNGTYNRPGRQIWYPPTGALTSNLPEVLQPFSANLADFTVIKKMKVIGGDHASGNSGFMTGYAWGGYPSPKDYHRGKFPR